MHSTFFTKASTTMQFHGHFVPAYRIREIRGVVVNLLKLRKLYVTLIEYESQQDIHVRDDSDERV
jgi:phage portal protein BeeE